jgi:hypothetical protein
LAAPFRFSEAVALERKPVCVVHEPIKDGVGQRRVADNLVPMFDRELTGDQG